VNKKLIWTAKIIAVVALVLLAVEVAARVSASIHLLTDDLFGVGKGHRLEDIWTDDGKHARLWAISLPFAWLLTSPLTDFWRSKDVALARSSMVSLIAGAIAGVALWLAIVWNLFDVGGLPPNAWPNLISATIAGALGCFTFDVLMRAIIRYVAP
jgi:hypothetical protein